MDERETKTHAAWIFSAKFCWKASSQHCQTTEKSTPPGTPYKPPKLTTKFTQNRPLGINSGEVPSKNNHSIEYQTHPHRKTPKSTTKHPNLQKNHPFCYHSILNRQRLKTDLNINLSMYSCCDFVSDIGFLSLRFFFLWCLVLDLFKFGFGDFFMKISFKDMIWGF